jgi:hypothetical protein
MTTADRLLSYLPPVYAGTGLVGALTASEAAEIDELRGALSSVLEQFFAASADWALARWEAQLGLAISPAVSDEERRARILARLRAAGTTTHARVVSVANSFENGDVIVIEDFAAYRVTLRFVSLRGVPPHVDQVISAVTAILPAHLELDVEYSYVTWHDFDAQNFRWGANPPGQTNALLDALNITFAQLPTFIPASP